MSTTPSKKKISTAKAAKFLGVSRWTLRRWGDKKELPFITSKTGYRYYQEADLVALKEKHAIVHVPAHKRPVTKATVHTAVVAQKEREETLLLPSPPKPEIIVQTPAAPIPTAPLPEAKPVELVVPPILTPPAPPKKKSVLSSLWKILPFTGASIFLLFILTPATHPSYSSSNASQMLSEKTPTSIIPNISFRDVVLAAATDSGDMIGASVQFFLSGQSEPANSLLSPDGKTPASGNAIYLSSMTNFSSFQDSPFAYLNGSHGAAGPVAIIEHADTLRSHPFFANVHDGDKLLIYKESAKAILFRPLTNEVIAFAPLDAVPSSSYEEIHGTPVVALRNGMGTPYDMKTFEAELTFVSPESVVVDNENASRSDYKKSFIVDVVGTKKDEAQMLANRLRLTVSTLPDGEFRPPAGVDFLVVLGKDRVALMNYIAPSSTASATPTPKN